MFVFHPKRSIDYSHETKPLKMRRLESLPSNRHRTLDENRFREMFPTASDEAMTFMKDCLRFNPAKRISAEAALRHPYGFRFLIGWSAELSESNVRQQTLAFRRLKKCLKPIINNHRYVSQFHNPTDEPECVKPITIALDDNTKLTVNDYREKLYQEVVRRRREGRRSEGGDSGANQQYQQYSSGQNGYMRVLDLEILWS